MYDTMNTAHALRFHVFESGLPMDAYIDSFRKFGKTNTDNQLIKIKRPYPHDGLRFFAFGVFGRGCRMRRPPARVRTGTVGYETVPTRRLPCRDLRFLGSRFGCLLPDDADREDAVAAADVVDDIEPLDNLPEAGVHAVEVPCILAVHADEELRATGVASGVGHREHAAVVALARRRGLAFDRVAWTARPVAPRAAALDHEIGDHPVEGQAVVEAVLGQIDEVGHGARGLVGVEFRLHVALLGGNDRVGFHGVVSLSVYGFVYSVTRIRAAAAFTRSRSASRSPSSGS